MSKPRVYLAGPIAGQNYSEATEWRETAKAFLADHGIDGFSPMRAKSYLNDGKMLMDGYKEFPLSTDDAITARDRMDVMRSDVVLFNFPPGLTRVSIGTCIEFGWADAFRKPCVVILDDLHDHAMIRNLTDFRANNLEDALHMIVSILKP